MQGNTSAIVTIDKARQAVRGIVIGSQTRGRRPKSFSEIEVAQASIIYPNGEIFILDTARVILICLTRMRGHRLKSAWDKNFLVGVRQKAEDGETRTKDARRAKCSDSYSSPGQYSARFFFVAHCPRASRRPRVRFSNLCHFLDVRLHAAAGMANFNGRESVANCSASRMSPLDSSATC
jgi:hypothetical protein